MGFLGPRVLLIASVGAEPEPNPGSATAVTVFPVSMTLALLIEVAF